MSNGVNQKMFGNWKSVLDLNGRWIRGEIFDNNAIRVWWALCCKHVERLRCFRNFSEAFVTGISGSAIKRNALTKHMGSAAHIRAEALENGPLPVTQILHTTPIGKPHEATVSSS